MPLVTLYNEWEPGEHVSKFYELAVHVPVTHGKLSQWHVSEMNDKLA